MMTDLRQAKRNRFFAGKILTAEDLTLEQDYFREKSTRHNRYLHGFGVVSGLDISSRGGEIVISSGLAVDCSGNEIVVAEPTCISLAQLKGVGGSIFLNLMYREVEMDPVPSIDSSSGTESSTILETFEALWEKNNRNAGHRHVKGRWLPCGQSHGLTIARLRLSSGRWRVDRRYRRPVIK